MNSQEIHTLQQSFSLVEPIAETAAGLFYARLFELDPALRPLFKSDLKSQGEKLMSSLKLVVSGLNNPEKIIPAVRNLGQRHANYGVQPEHYTTVGEALLWTLERGLGTAYTPEVAAAWGSAFGLLSGLMQEAASEAVL
ncbi:MAG: hemin receptor [Chloroflexi bacterium]|nr:hemin receptor [Chloroflexota bacterium]MBP8056532.1 hemin receptor [Chloroflexota bacterium]